MTEGLAIVATAISVATAGSVAGLFVLRAVVAKDVKPLNDVLIGLTINVKSLTDTLSEERDLRHHERKDMQQIIRGLEVIVRDLDRRTTWLEGNRHPMGERML